MSGEIKIEYKKILFIVLSTLLLLCIIAYMFYVNLNKDTSSSEKKLEMVVKYSGDGYIIVEDDEGLEYILDVQDKYNVGDKLKVELENVDDTVEPITADVIKIKVLKSKDDSLSDDGEEVITDSNVNSSNGSNALNDNSSNNKTDNNLNNSSSGNNNYVTQDEDIVSYFREVEQKIDDNNSSIISDSIKNGFVTVVDFLFYGGSIKGKTFNELSSSCKLTVLKIALSIDKKIDNHFPNYKNTLSNKYKNIKSLVISKYLDITSDACSKNTDTCNAAKEGFTELKHNFSITWSFIKDISGVGVTKLKNWYEIWKTT